MSDAGWPICARLRLCEPATSNIIWALCARKRHMGRPRSMSVDCCMKGKCNGEWPCLTSADSCGGQRQWGQAMPDVAWLLFAGQRRYWNSTHYDEWAICTSHGQCMQSTIEVNWPMCQALTNAGGPRLISVGGCRLQLVDVTFPKRTWLG